MDSFQIELSAGKKEVIVREELSEEDFRGECRELAREMVGNLLINSETGAGGLVTETEAYIGEKDPSCHLSAGVTKRTRPILKGPGTVYVFKIYNHHNLNVITEYRGHPECILIRALHPTHGMEGMRERRGTGTEGLTTGPGRLTEALGITKEEFNGQGLSESPLEIFGTDLDAVPLTTRRVGISSAEDWPLRYVMEESPFVSKKLQPVENRHREVENVYKEFQSVQTTLRT